MGRRPGGYGDWCNFTLLNCDFGNTVPPLTFPDYGNRLESRGLLGFSVSGGQDWPGGTRQPLTDDPGLFTHMFPSALTHGQYL